MHQVLFTLPILKGVWIFPPDGIPVYGFGAMLFVTFIAVVWWGTARAKKVNMEATKFQDFARAYGGFDFQSGWLSIYTELASAKGPQLRDLWRSGNVFSTFFFGRGCCVDLTCCYLRRAEAGSVGCGHPPVSRLQLARACGTDCAVEFTTAGNRGRFRWQNLI